MTEKKVTVFAGHYGSGKTNLAVNFALSLRKKHPQVAVCDLDIVNPYFRTKDSEKLLAESGIRLISSEFANSNVDIPSFPAAAYSMFSGGDMRFVADLGGDDRGAYALGRFSDMMKDPGAYDMLLVLNKYRPDTGDVPSALEIVAEIEAACKVKFTGVVNNSNLGRITACEHVEKTVGFAEEVAKALGLSVVMTSYNEEIGTPNVPNPYPIRMMRKDIWDI